MCGIVGLYRWPGAPEEIRARLQAMCDAIRHRGPDDEGFLVDGEAGLGARRLSIIDVAGGHQPIPNEDGTAAVAFNGEIYNHPALRRELTARGHRFRTRTDTEVIVHAYEEDGPACAARLNGIFGFAVWDRRARRLVLARDRMGVKPLYYTEAAGGLAFASEIKALLTLPEVPRALDAEAAGEFFRLGYVPAPRTLFAGIAKLPPGWWLEAADAGYRLQPYWDLRFAAAAPALSFAECRDRLRVLLAEAVADQMVSEVPLGAFLSGGVDSSAVVALMQQAARGPVKTYSIGFENAAYHNEAPYAEAVAKALGTEHQTLIVRPQVADLLPALVEKLDEPLVDSSFMVSYLVSELAARSVTVALSGVGGDELFGGYRRYLAPGLHRATAWLPAPLRGSAGRLLARLPADRRTTLGNLCRYAKSLGETLHLPLGEQYLGLVGVLAPERIRALLGRGNGHDPGALIPALFAQAAPAAPLDRLLYVDAKTLLPESLLLLTDKMGMAASLEVRVPFLDNRVVEFVAGVPAAYRLRGFRLKRLLKAAVRGLVPEFVLTRSKRGFGTPMGDWLRGDLRPLVEDLLGEARLRREGLFDPAVVRGLLAAHAARSEDGTEAILALLTFEIWRDRFQVKCG
jgi:asparagine synthase (glutamine-hydrolysing)